LGASRPFRYYKTDQVTAQALSVYKKTIAVRPLPVAGAWRKSGRLLTNPGSYEREREYIVSQ
jgi:hypothetical protein